jgi:hypothetical protein
VKQFAMSMYASQAELFQAKALHFEELAEKLAKFTVAEYYGAIGDRDEADEVLIELGWVSGLSEDTYYEMNPFGPEGYNE